MSAGLDRQELFADGSLAGTVFCRAYSRRVDEWLASLFDTNIAGSQAIADSEGIALVAVGGYGRSTLSPQSDIDVLLLHSDRLDVTELAQGLWYPIWDEGLKLGHSVRTVKEALALAKTDLDTATSLLHLRHLAGDEDLTLRLLDGARTQWRRNAKSWLPQLADAATRRIETHGEVAFLLEPDLKESSGGLRDVHALQWASVADEELIGHDPRPLRVAYESILAARVELHRATGRHSDRLTLEDQDAVAAALGIEDADVLMTQVAGAARAITWVCDETWARVRARSSRRSLRKSVDIGDGLELELGTVRYANGVPAGDPIAPLRLALAAASNEARVDHAALTGLARDTPPLPDPWPDDARQLFVDLLATGWRAIPVIEALDQTGLFVGILPEWEPCQSRPQRNVYHRFTVDRHLCETAAQAAELTARVDRPDLLLVGALLHDIGKGYDGDHTVVGMDLIASIGARMGFPPADLADLVAMVEHHLLLPDVATRRDIEDEGTIASVAEQVGTVQVLRLLGALTEADSISTGPSAWSDWKAGLVRDLVARTEHRLSGGAPGSLPPSFPTDEQRQAMATGTRRVQGSHDALVVIVEDRPGLFTKAAGVLALNGLDVIQAAVHSEEGMAAEMFVVEPEFENPIDWPKVIDDVDKALDGKLAIHARLAQRVATYGSPSTSGPRPIVQKKVTFDNEVSTASTVVEVAAPNSIGLLCRITRALGQMSLDIRRAKVQTLGDHVVDSFYVRDMNGRKVTDPEYLAEIELAVLHAVDAPSSG
jgi:[protein-PII] uridylyltransferase